jgi:hypothetical protein
VNVVESDAGFYVEVLGRTGLRYVENGKSMFIDSEALATPGAMVLYRASIKKWQAPHESDAVEEDDRSRIIQNIRLAFQFKGHQLDVI